MFDEKADPRTPGTSLEVSDDEGLWLEYVTCPFCQGLFAVDFTYIEQVSDHVHCPICCMEVVITDPDEEISTCDRCDGAFTPKTVYWHNYNIVGFFCDRCFDEVVEETGSGAKLAEIRKENG